MANDYPLLAEELLRDMDAGVKAAAALRAIAVMPDSLRAQGARICLFIACILLAADRPAVERAVAGLRRAVASVTVIRDLYAQGKPPPGRRLHPEVAAILEVTMRGQNDLIGAVNGFLGFGQEVLRSIDRNETPDRRVFDAIVNHAFAGFLPAISRLRARTEEAVAAVRARNDGAADRAHCAAQEALRRIDRLTRIVRMISVNARVEAARAGAAGRSFNVIATEITDLAGQVEAASADISHRIEDIVTSFRAI